MAQRAFDCKACVSEPSPLLPLGGVSKSCLGLDRPEQGLTRLKVRIRITGPQDSYQDSRD